ncbi:MAG: hypothetical protein AAF497_28560, partial [Planctomycetota bacterium]
MRIVSNAQVTIDVSDAIVARLPDGYTPYTNAEGFQAVDIEVALPQLDDNYQTQFETTTVASGMFVEVFGLTHDQSYRLRLEGNEQELVSLAGNFDENDCANNNLSTTNEFEFCGPADGVMRIRVDSTHRVLPDELQQKIGGVKYVLERESSVFNNSWLDVANATASGETTSAFNTAGVTMAKMRQLQLDFIKGAVIGSDDLDVGLAGDLTVSLIPGIGVYADIRDLVKQVYRAAVHHGLGVEGINDFSAIDTAIAAAGIVAEFFPPADYAVDGVRALVKMARANANLVPLVLGVGPIFLDALDALWDAAWHPSQSSPGRTSASRGTILTDLMRSIGDLRLNEVLDELGGWTDVIYDLVESPQFRNKFISLFNAGDAAKVTDAVQSLVKHLGAEELKTIIVHAVDVGIDNQTFAKGIVALGDFLSETADESADVIRKALKGNPESAGKIVANLGSFVSKASPSDIVKLEALSSALSAAAKKGILTSADQLK